MEKDFSWEPADVLFKEVHYEEQVFDENPPVPYIHSINAEGLVKIRFNSTMRESATLLNSEVESAVNRRRNLQRVATNSNLDENDEYAPVVG